jgi:enoyl-CoA hydratase/carnithine racemase
MVEKCVLYHKMGDVGKITINRLEADNAINIRVAEELAGKRRYH